MWNDITTFQADLVRRLHCATGHLQGITGMVERGIDCETLVHQTLAVQAALREVNRLILKHHLEVCLAQRWQEANPMIREQDCAEIVALYHLLRNDR